MRLIGGRWKGSIIYHLKDGPVRFNDMARMLGGASKKMVDQRLKELESEGMVLRKVISERPIAVSYELTDFGRSARKILDDLRVASEAQQIKIRQSNQRRDGGSRLAHFKQLMVQTTSVKPLFLQASAQ